MANPNSHLGAADMLGSHDVAVQVEFERANFGTSFSLSGLKG
jgi:hypothetical protein